MENKTHYRTFNPIANPLEKIFKHFSDVPKMIMDSVPSINIQEEKDAMVFSVATAGLKKEDIDIKVERNILTVSCNAKKEPKAKENSEFFSHIEFDYSSFTRSFTIPEGCDTDKISAKYEHGVLAITISKRKEGENRKSSKINID